MAEISSKLPGASPESIKQAVILAADEGSELRPLTLTRAKAMLPVVNRPIVGHILYLLQRQGIERVVIATQYLANQILDYFGDGRSMDMSIEYVIEETPAGGAGSVKQAAPYLDAAAPFVVIRGDILTDFDIQSLYRVHRESGAAATIAATYVTDPTDYTVVARGEDGLVTKLVTRPAWGEVSSDLVDAGIYVVEPRVLDNVLEGEPTDWVNHVFPALLAQGERVVAHVVSGYWCCVVTLEDYRRACADLLNGHLKLGDLGHHIGGGVWTGGPVEIHPDAQLFGPIYLGEEVKIKSGVVVHGPAVISDYAILDNRVRVDRSVIWRNCYIGEGAELHGSVIGQQCSQKARAVLFEGSVISDRTVIGEDAVIQPSVKVWPDKEIEPGATVNHSIVWGSQGRRSIFSQHGVSGVVNVDLTPEFAGRLGSAYGSVLEKRAVVALSSDHSSAARTLARSIAGSLPSGGLHVLDLGVQALPVVRYQIRTSQLGGGLHVTVAPHEGMVLDVRLLDRSGMDIDRSLERQIQGVFLREDFRRAYKDDIGLLRQATRVDEWYVDELLKTLNPYSATRKRYNLAIDYCSSPTAQVLPSLLNRLACGVIALNADLNEALAATPLEDWDAALSRLCEVTVASMSDLGIRIDPRGEGIEVVTSEGVPVNRYVLCAVLTDLMLSAHPGKTVVIPFDFSNVAERVAAARGGKIHRVRRDRRAIMEASTEPDVVMVADGKGRYIFPEFQPCFDGFAAVVKLLDLLAHQGRSIDDCAALIPPFFLSEEEFESTWESKGRVMRQLSETLSKYELEFVDGLKVHLSDEEWVSIRPDPDRPIFHVVAEASSAPMAQKIVAKYGRLVVSLVQVPYPQRMPEA